MSDHTEDVFNSEAGTHGEDEGCMVTGVIVYATVLLRDELRD